MGSIGDNGHPGAVRSVVASFPICESSQEIANNCDAAKLEEFLAAGCSATIIPAKDATVRVLLHEKV